MWALLFVVGLAIWIVVPPVVLIPLTVLDRRHWAVLLATLSGSILGGFLVFWSMHQTALNHGDIPPDHLPDAIDTVRMLAAFIVPVVAAGVHLLALVAGETIAALRAWIQRRQSPTVQHS